MSGSLYDGHNRKPGAAKRQRARQHRHARRDMRYRLRLTVEERGFR